MSVISLCFQSARDVVILCLEYLCAVCVHDCASSDSGIYCALWKSPKMDGKSATTAKSRSQTVVIFCVCVTVWSILSLS